MDTVILGNGIVGLATAHSLAQRGSDRITIIGPQTREGSATLAAAAMLNSFAEVEVGSLKAPLDQLRFELSRKASTLWPAFGTSIASAVEAGRTIADLGFQTGTFVVNNTAADDLDDENFDAILAALSAYAEPHALVSPREIPNYAPDQRHRATRAVRIEREGWVNPRLVMAHLDRALAQHPHVRIIDASVERLASENGAITGAILPDGRVVEGDRYLLAVGATATALLERSALAIPMQRVFYGVGVSLELRSPDHPHTHCIRTPNRGLACGVYSAPYFQGTGLPNDHVLIGASNFIARDPQPHGRLTSVEVLSRAAIEQINHHFYRADLVRVNVGWRPTSQDTYPLVGPTSIPNLVIATGTKRDGFHLAPLLAEHLAALIRGEPTDARLDVFRPERPPIRTLTRAEAIEKAVRHQISAAYQHGYNPATSRMPEAVIEMHRAALERLHDQVGAVDWGIPPEMIDMYRYGHAKP